MPVDQKVLDALRKALDQDPDSTPLRLYLASLLLVSGDSIRAMSEFTQVLKNQPTNVDALRGAASAAAALGQKDKADEYRNKLLPVRPPQEPPPPSGPSPVAAQVDWKPDDSAAEPTKFEKPHIKLADVGGMEAVKRRLHLSFLGPLKNPELRQAYKKSLRGGLLLYGPPGCGKTYIARALAGEMGAQFISIGINDVLSMWLGQSETRLHQLFVNARRKQPAVLFFDEIDALGHKRSHMPAGGGGRNVINVLLSEMDGVDSSNEGLFILAATNHPWDVDTALRRPGRFDRVVLVLPPDEKARQAILYTHLKDRPSDGVDIAWLAKKTPDFSGADLAYLCEAATERAMEESFDSGKVRPLTTDDFKAAMKDVRPSTRAWFETAKNYAMFANEGGVYDDLLAYLSANKI